MAERGWDDLPARVPVARLAEPGDAPSRLEAGRLEQPSVIRRLLSENPLDESIRALQEDLALLQAQQERGLSTLGGALEHIGQELGAVRAQLSALAEPLLATQVSSDRAEEELGTDSHWTEAESRLARLDRQVVLLVRGMEAVDSLRYQSEVHTRALARLTDLLAEVARPRPVEGLIELEQSVAAVKRCQDQLGRFQPMSLALLALAATPGLGALVWLLLGR